MVAFTAGRVSTTNRYFRRRYRIDCLGRYRTFSRLITIGFVRRLSGPSDCATEGLIMKGKIKSAVTWTRLHPWTTTYLCIVVTADLVINLINVVFK